MSQTKKPSTPRPNGQGARAEPWKPGQTGNTSGWHGMGRAKLSSKVVHDFITDWEAHGAKAIATVRDTKPVDYLKIVAGLLPKHFNIKVSELHELSDEELQRRCSALIAQLGLRPAGDADGGGAEALALPPQGLLPIR